VINVEKDKQRIVVDAGGLVAGRLASIVAKMLLRGEEVVIVNAEKALVTGEKMSVINRFKRRLKWRTYYNPERRGVKRSRMPDRLLKRMIRGMLPRKKKRGREALKRLKVYIGLPEEFKDVEKIIFEDAKPRKVNEKYVTLAEISRNIGGLKE